MKFFALLSFKKGAKTRPLHPSAELARGVACTFFIEAIEGRVIGEAAALTCGHNALAARDELSDHNEAFGDNVVIDGGAGHFLKNSVDLRGAHMNVSGEAVEGNVAAQIAVDIGEHFATDVAVHFTDLSGILFKKSGIEGAQKVGKVGDYRGFWGKNGALLFNLFEKRDGVYTRKLSREVLIFLAQLAVKKGSEELICVAKRAELVGAEGQHEALVGRFSLNYQSVRFGGSHYHNAAGEKGILVSLDEIFGVSRHKAEYLKSVVNVQIKRRLQGVCICVI